MKRSRDGRTGRVVGRAQLVPSKRTVGDKEIWRVPAGDKVIVTTTTSGAVMDEAVVRYEGALKRLAKK